MKLSNIFQTLRYNHLFSHVKQLNPSENSDTLSENFQPCVNTKPISKTSTASKKQTLKLIQGIINLNVLFPICSIHFETVGVT